MRGNERKPDPEAPGEPPQDAAPGGSKVWNNPRPPGNVTALSTRPGPGAGCRGPQSLGGRVPHNGASAAQPGAFLPGEKADPCAARPSRFPKSELCI